MSIDFKEMHRFLIPYRFMVTLGEMACGFTSVTNIENSIEYDTIQVGGVNDRVLTWQKPRSQQHRLIFEKGIARDNIWYREMANRKASKGSYQRSSWQYGSEIAMGRMYREQGGSIVIFDDNFDIKVMYNFNNAVIVRWEASNLSGTDAQVMVERMEVVHDGLIIAT